MKQFQKSLLVAMIILASFVHVCAADNFDKGLALFNKQSYAEALQCFSAGTTGGGKESQCLYYCALCYLKKGESAKAQEIFQQICKRFPTSEAAGHAARYLKASESKSADLVAPAKPPDFIDMSALPDEVSIPFRRTSKGQITVVAALHGHSMSMIFDTGAEVCLFGANQLDQSNLSNVERSKAAIVNSVSGPMRVFQIVTDIQLGPMNRRLPVCVQDSDMDTAILGQPFLKGFACSIDNQAGLIRLRRESSLRNFSPLDSFSVPFSEVGEKLIVNAKVNGRYQDMCFDTGAFGVCMSKSQCEKTGLKVPDTLATQTKGPNGQMVNSWEINADLSLGPINKKSFPIRVIDSDTSYPLLGLNFFGNRTYSIDRSKKEIRFSN